MLKFEQHKRTETEKRSQSNSWRVTVARVILIPLVIGFILFLLPAPYLVDSSPYIEKSSITVALFCAASFLMWMWFTKPGHVYLARESKSSLSKQAAVFLIYPIALGFFVWLFLFGAQMSFVGIYTSLFGQSYLQSGVVTKVIVIPQFGMSSEARRCRNQVWIQWESSKESKKVCASEELAHEFKVGDIATQKYWHLSDTKAKAALILPQKLISERLIWVEYKYKSRALFWFLVLPLVFVALVVFWSKGRWIWAGFCGLLLLVYFWN
jgi:hypothetical protein